MVSPVLAYEETTTTFALWMQQQSGPIHWKMLRTAFLQEQLRFGGTGPKLLPSARPGLCSLLVQAFEMHRIEDDCRLLLVADRMLMPGKLYRFSFWLDLEDSYAAPNVEAFCRLPRDRIFLFSHSRKSRARPGWGRLSYFVAVPEPVSWAMSLLLFECDPQIALFRREQRSARRERKPKRRARRVVRERRTV